MNDSIKQHVLSLLGGAATEEEIIDKIRWSKTVWTGYESDRRWWTDCFTVVDVGGMLIGFDDAKTTGDNSPRDCGWEFDPSSICEVKVREVVKTVYDRVE